MFFERKKNNDFLSINIENLIDWNEPNGEGCIVSDRITKEGFKVGYMYREAPDEDNPDSGWRFLAGNEGLYERIKQSFCVFHQYNM